MTTLLLGAAAVLVVLGAGVFIMLLDWVEEKLNA